MDSEVKYYYKYPCIPAQLPCMKSRTVLLATAFLVLCALFAFGPFRYSQDDHSGARKTSEHGGPGLAGAQFVASNTRTTVQVQSEASRYGFRDGESTSPPPPSPSKNYFFDPHGSDCLVFIHIPKTGGSDFLRHLVTVERQGEPLCSVPAHPDAWKKDRRICPRAGGGQAYMSGMNMSDDPWLISEKTLGWYCGLHPFYSEYLSCISLEAKREEAVRKFNPSCQFHFATLLRHPILRYISEYLHVQRGATFSYRHICNEHEVRDQEMPPCYPGFYDKATWVNVTLPKFLSCESNWGNNRQTLSIADLDSVGCFDKTKMSRQERDRRILQSAKDNLNKFAFFGITEYQVESALLFEKTFGMKFGSQAAQKPVSKLHSAPMLHSIWNSPSSYDRIAQANHLDMQLYNFALQLFSSRLKAIGVKIDLSRVSDEINHLPTDSDAFIGKRFSKLNFDLDLE